MSWICALLGKHRWIHCTECMREYSYCLRCGRGHQ